MSERILELAVPQCSADDFDGEIVAINLDTGIYYSIRESAALVWHDLADGHSVETLLDVVREDADGQAAISRFVDELLGSGLMRPSVEIRRPVAAPRIASALPLAAPVLEPFGDMQDLLLLDPVHEVDQDAGWPNAPDRSR